MVYRKAGWFLRYSAFSRKLFLVTLCLGLGFTSIKCDSGKKTNQQKKIPEDKPEKYFSNNYPDRYVETKSIKFNIIFVHHVLFKHEDVWDGFYPTFGHNNWYSEIHPLLEEKNSYVFAGDGRQIRKIKDGVHYVSSSLSTENVFHLVKVYTNTIKIDDILVK